MKNICKLFFLTLMLMTPLCFGKGIALRVNINGAIGPAVADHTQRAIEHAAKTGAALTIIQMDTPGGLDYSMRTIIKAILASPIPVVTYVSPSGSRAASAGTFILYASHVAAMAPGTNLGAASPVAMNQNVGHSLSTIDKLKKATEKAKDDEGVKDILRTQKETMRKKVTNDAIAYIKSLAEMRGRNAEWAVKAVKEAATLSAEDAKKNNVIDIVANDFTDLFEQINGLKVEIKGKPVEIKSKNLTIEDFPIDWRTRLLMIITNPSIAYILLMLGMYGLFFEFFHPGTMVPGVVGAIALVTALYAMQLLPINYAGLVLILLGIAFMVAESFMPSFGILGIGGTVAFLIGSILLFDTDVPEYRVAWPVILTITAANVGMFSMVISMALRSHRRKVVVGRENIVGEIGITLEDIETTGQARIQGERWKVEAEQPIAAGTKVKVIAIKGLVLTVKTVDQD